MPEATLEQQPAQQPIPETFGGDSFYAEEGDARQPDSVYDYDDGPGRTEPGESAGQESAGRESEGQASGKPQERHPDGFSDALLQRAGEYGFQRDDFASPQQLERAIAAMDRQMAKLGRGQSQPPGQSPGQPTQHAPQQQQQETPAEFKLELDESLYDPDLVKAVRGMNEFYQGQMGQLRQQLETVTNHFRQQQQAAFEREFDGWIAALGDDYAELFGKGSGRDLAPGSQELAHRVQLLEEMDALAAGYRVNGRDVPSEDVLFQRAVNSVFGAKQQEIARKQVSQKVRDRQGRFIARPTQREGKPAESPEDRAKQHVRNFLRDRGIVEEDDFI